MVECESITILTLVENLFGFNRYMVECESLAVGVLERDNMK